MATDITCRVIVTQKDTVTGTKFTVVDKIKTYSALNTEDKHKTQLATASQVVIWDPTAAGSTDNCPDFDFAVFTADQNVDLELFVNRGNANEQVISVRVLANCPFVIYDDGSYDRSVIAQPGGITWPGALNSVINKIVMRNDSGSTVNYDLRLYT